MTDRRYISYYSQLRVPFFKVTSSMDDIKMQHKVLSILQDMIDDEEDEKQ